MKRAVITIASAVAALFAVLIGLNALLRIIQSEDWGYTLIAVWCVCVLISSFAAMGRRA